MFESGQRVGCDVLDLHTGRRRPLDRIVASPDSPATIGAYRFDDEAVAEGNSAIIAAVRRELDVVAIDEVGPLEFRGGGWAPALAFALRECRASQGLIVVVRPALVDRLPEQFPSPAWATARRVTPPWPRSLLA